MLRRPMLYVAAALAAAVFISAKAGGIYGAAVILITGFVVMNIRFSSSRIRGRVILLLVSFIAGFLAVALWDVRADPLKDFAEGNDGQAVYICGQVTIAKAVKDPSGEKYLRLIVKPDEFQHKPVNTSRQLLVNCYKGCFDSGRSNDIDRLESAALPGVRVEISGCIKLPKERRNPGCFDYKQYLRSINVTTVSSPSRIQLIVDEKPGFVARIRMFLHGWKRNFIAETESRCGQDTAAFVNAVMFGDKGMLDQDMLESFQRNGTAHVLAVSGLHVGMIYAFILRLWAAGTWLVTICWRGLGKTVKAGKTGWGLFVFAGAFFCAYMVMADFAPSVVRAVIMVMLHQAALITCRRYDLKSAAFLVIVAMLLKNPYMLFNTGFQMSFLAVLTMSLVLPFIKSFYKGVFLASAAVQVGLGPFMMYNFNYLSLLAVFINLPVVALTGLLVPLGLCSMILSAVPCLELIPFGQMGQGFISQLIYILCYVLKWMNSMCDSAGVTNFLIGSPKTVHLFFYYLVLLLLASEEGRLFVLKAGVDEQDLVKRYTARLKRALCVLLAAGCLALAAGTFTDGNFSKADVVFLDVGQGDCMHVKARKGMFGPECNYLIDGGGSTDYQVGEKTVKPYLLKAGVTEIDAAFVTHLHTDHYKGICELARDGMVKKLYVYEGNRVNLQRIIEETGLKADDILFLKAGQRLCLGEERGGFLERFSGRILDQDRRIMMDVLWPEGKTDKEYAGMAKDEKDENNMSLILRLAFGGGSGPSMLVTGDIDQDCEKEMAGIYDSCRLNGGGSVLDIDVLKVAHHGSRYSSSDAFLRVASPGFAVIQVGENNNYGHPAREVLDRLQGKGVRIYRTDKMGAVGLLIKKDRVSITSITD